MENNILGVDISKKTFDVALLREGKFKHKKFSNTEAGFKELSVWLERLKVSAFHACMEATGTYGEALAQYLYDAGFTVSVVNPARIKGFAQGELMRTKTDKSDASLIARFCLAMRPSSWAPEAYEIRLLRDLSRRHESLLEMRQQEVNRLDVIGKEVQKDVKRHISYLDKLIEKNKQKIHNNIDNNPDLKHKKELLESIPGIGEVTISVILSEFADISRFDSAKHLTSFLGIAPKHRQSGTSVRGRTCMSKIGNAKVRKSFFMPALVAMRHNPIFIEMRARLLKAGKPKMLIVGAVMRKLIHIIYGVLKNDLPFDPNFRVQKA
jgi:transposase